MEQSETKYIVEVRKNYRRNTDGTFLNGKWEVLKDEFGLDSVFDYYYQAHRALQENCPALEMFGKNVGRVSEVEMVRKLK
jgi:hypothetical protein